MIARQVCAVNGDGHHTYAHYFNCGNWRVKALGRIIVFA